MKTLILNGSPHFGPKYETGPAFSGEILPSPAQRPGGDTAALISALSKGLRGEVTEVFAYRPGIAPCTDCRACMKTEGCAIHDGMDAVYEAIREADAVVIASPLYFSELTGPLLSLGSRLQCLYAARRFLGKKPLGGRRGGILLTGGGDGGPEKALSSAHTLLKLMGVTEQRHVMSLSTDRLPAWEDQKAMEDALALAKWLCGDC